MSLLWYLGVVVLLVVLVRRAGDGFGLGALFGASIALALNWDADYLSRLTAVAVLVGVSALAWVAPAGRHTSSLWCVAPRQEWVESLTKRSVIQVPAYATETEARLFARAAQSIGVKADVRLVRLGSRIPVPRGGTMVTLEPHGRGWSGWVDPGRQG